MDRRQASDEDCGGETVTKNQSDYDIPERKYDFFTDLKFGQKGEKLVGEFLEALSEGAFEVKTDRYRNGRMVVEIMHNPRKKVGEDGKPLWKPSGLSVTKAKWWAYVYTLDGAFVMVSVPRLKRYLAAHPDRFNTKTLVDFARASSNPSKGYLLMPEDVMDMLINPMYDDAVRTDKTAK
jgi:hypothetical protein